MGLGGWGGWYLCLVDKRGSVMSGIMRPGHPSATCRLEMRDLVSSRKPLGVSWLRKGRVGGWGVGGGSRCIPEFLHPPPLPPPPPSSSLSYLF